MKIKITTYTNKIYEWEFQGKTIESGKDYFFNLYRDLSEMRIATIDKTIIVEKGKKL
jgi:hypothetical protein